MHACDIKFRVINIRGTCLIRENHEHLYPRNNYTLYTYKINYTVYTVMNLYKISYPKHVPGRKNIAMQ